MEAENACREGALAFYSLAGGLLWPKSTLETLTRESNSLEAF